MFAASFELNAERPCVREGDRVLTYADVARLGQEVIADLPSERQFVVLRCSLTAKCIAAYCALLSAGHVPLLLESDLATSLSADLYARFAPAWVIDPCHSTVERRDSPEPSLHADLALLLTTSGSTGSPKLVRLSAKGVHANAEAIGQYLALDPSERALLHLPMSYSYGLSIINSHLLTGGSIGLTRASVMEPGYWDDFDRYEATSVSGVPFHYTALRRFADKRLDRPHLRTLTQAGGRLDPKLVGWFAQWAESSGRKFYVMYGQTEAGPRIAYLPPDKAVTAPDAIGEPIPGTTINLVDEQGLPVAEGETGTLRVTSPSIMMGYANDASDFAGGYEIGNSLDTGDLAKRGSDGLLRIVGRNSRVLKLYGLRINLDELERRFSEEGYVAQCFGEDDNLNILIEGGPTSPDMARERIIALYSLPPRAIQVRSTASLPRSGSGKVSSQILREAWLRAGANSHAAG